MTTVEETLGWEAEQRPRAVAAAIGGGILLLASNILLLAALRDFPTIDLIEALSGGDRLKVEQVLFLDDRMAALTAAGIAGGIALLAMGYALYYLLRATAARREELPGMARILILVGPAASALGFAMLYVGRAVSAASFAGGDDRSAEAASDALNPPVQGIGQLLLVLGSFALALGIFFVALNAMRAGLLTRFMGVLGIIVALLWVLPLDQAALVRSVWLVLLGLVFAARNPGGQPPAWQTGRAEPWPTQQQLREQREAAAGVVPAAAEPEPDPAVPAAAKRKRKRRR